MNRKFWMFAAILLLAVRLPCAAVTAPDIGEGVLDDPNYRPPSSGGGSTSSGGGYSRPTYQQPQVDYDAIRRQQQMERQRIEAERRRQAAEAERKRKAEAARQLQLKRNAEAASAAKAWAAEDAANDKADAPRKGKSDASQPVKKGLPALLRKTQKLPCALCVNGWRDCPSCEGSVVHCHRSGCHEGWEVCGCVKSQNNFQPDPDCRFCHGSGRTKCEACGGKSAWPCPDCQGKGKLPCPFCEAGARAASSASGIKPGGSYAASAPTPGTYPVSAQVAAQQALRTRFLGPNPATKPTAQDLERLSQAQKKLAEEDKRLAQATSARPPQSPVSPDLDAAKQALEKRELALIQQAMDNISKGDVPTDPAKKQALVDQIKADFAKDPERIKLLAEVARLEAAAPMPGVAAQQLAKAVAAAQSFATSGGGNTPVLVPSFSGTVALLPGATPAVSGSLGKPVGYSAGMIETVAKNYEKNRWDNEARLIETRHTIQDFQAAVYYLNQSVAQATADYDKIKGQPGVPATLADYLKQRRTTDELLDGRYKEVEDHRYDYRLARYREKDLMETVDFQNKYMKELIDGNPDGAKVAAKVRQESMDERIKQLEQIVEAQKQQVAKGDASTAELEKQYAKQEAAYRSRLEAERPKAQAEYDKLDAKRKASQDFDSYLFSKVAQTPEADAFFNRDTDFYRQLAWSSDMLTDMSREHLQEAQQKLQALRQGGTLLGGSEWWSKQAATLHPKRDPGDEIFSYIMEDYYLQEP